MAAKRPTSGMTGPTAHQNNVMQGLILHQHISAAEEAKKQAEEHRAAAEEAKKELDAMKKKAELDKKHHEETRKELDKLKSQFDAGYAFEKKQVRRDTMNRVRLAKGKVKKDVATMAKEAKRAQTTNKSTGTARPKSRKASS